MAIDDRIEAPPHELADELLTAGDRSGLMRHMLLMRAVEERGVLLYKQGKVPGSFYDGRGQEAIGVGAAWAMDRADPICSPLIRDLGAHLVRGTDLAEIFAHYMGRENALSHGRDGNVHFGDRTRGIVGMVSMLPDMMVVAVGLAMAFRMRGERRCALTFFGDGASSRGDWHEAMNMAAIDRLPVVFVLENNQLAYSTPNERQFAVDPVHRAAGYGIASESIDGNDVEAVFLASWRARERALAGGGPTLIEARTMRMHGHGAHDDARYVAPALRREWEARDPIARYAAALEAHGIDVAPLREEVEGAVQRAVELALRAPLPDPESATAGVFCEGDAVELGGDAEAPWSGFALAAGG